MVIGKLSGFASLIVILILAGLFLRQASASSIGVAGQDVGAGLSGVAGGITALISSIFNPITSAIGGFSSFIQNPFGTNKEEQNRASNEYGRVRQEPAPSTSRVTSGSATQSTISSQSGYTSGAITAHRSTGGFGRAN
jgi:hypothetical protein